MDWFDPAVPPAEHDRGAGELDWVRSLAQDALLDLLRSRKPEMHFFGTRNDPRAIGYVIYHQTCADVTILRGENDASAFRVPTLPGPDPFAPTLVSWQYHASATWTLRAVLTLQPPGTPGAPQDVLRPDPRCIVPSEWRQQVTLRPA